MDEPAEPADIAGRIKQPRARFVAPKSVKARRRIIRCTATAEVAIAVNVLAAQRDISVSALVLDALRRLHPSLATAIDAEVKRQTA
jgi:hypothetical protein